jgi:methyltransferase (TIGR00027 family)
MDDGGPSATARRVAAYRLGFTRVPAAYGDPAADEALAADVAAGQQPSADRMREYLAGRTTFFDTVVTRAIGRGLRQIVVGAAGYDGRAFRYAKRGVRWFEVDHPATQRDKRERLDRLGIAAGEVRFVEADFTRDPVAERLLEAGLDPARPSLFLLEGVAVYLELAVLESVLGQFCQVAQADSRLAISVSLSSPGQARSRFRDAVASLGEPARSTLEADEAEQLLARTGWLVVAAGDLDRPEAAARHERLHSAGLLTARATTPRAAASPTAPRAASSRPSSSRLARTPAPHNSAALPASPLCLSTLLSQALVAFTIEFDNEGEHQAPHRTTNYGPSIHGDGAWLVSMVMWENCMRFVTDEPITVAELLTQARTATNFDGMRRWGYITIDGTARKTRQGHPGPNAVLRATARGLRAREIWLPLAGLIEQRWRDRFGTGLTGRLREALAAVTSQLDPGLPDCLPILSQELRSRGPDPALPPRPGPVDAAALPLPALLSRVLLSFALEYEQEAELSLAVSANLLRVLGPEGIRLRDLPALSGISKEAVRWALGVLTRSRRAVEDPDPAARRGKVARLTPRGLEAQDTQRELLAAIEQRWRDRFTPAVIDAIRQPLETLALPADGRPPSLFDALQPHPDNWRAQIRPPSLLPYYPMVLHRGGYPDGS